jgi:hypothetical protein
MNRTLLITAVVPAACLALLSSAAAAAPSASAPAPAASRPASAAGWGRPVAPPTRADGEDDGRANGDYFHDLGELIVRVRSVGWIEQICSDAFPANAELNRRAYADWLQTHKAFVDEMEVEFALIPKRWADASPNAAKEGFTMQQLEARLDAHRAALQDDFLAKPRVTQQKRCDAYPQLLLSRTLDLEKSQADLVHSVRLGPR